mmetsp:Transcript_20377/g.61895  ORF Transcript_20377/g.61895 Transcript_20377/m.61895 type:complete len:477 (-) Transcript_20377:1118-2548(-)
MALLALLIVGVWLGLASSQDEPMKDATSVLYLGNDTRMYMPLEHVCLGNKQIHFFRNETAVALFKEHQFPYVNWVDFKWREEPMNVVHHTDTTFDAFVKEHGMRYVTETSLLGAPHHVDNNFHMHNDFLLPTLFDALRNGAGPEMPKEEKRLFLWRGWLRRVHNYGMLFKVPEELFKAVEYPLEDEFNNDKALCFRRFIWGQGMEPQPFYTHEGRFGPHDRWRGAMHELRDWIFTGYGLPASVPVNNTEAPKVTWVARRPGHERSIKRLEDLVAKLEAKGMDVEVVKVFERSRESAKKLLARLRETNILIGMHGAGLAHSVYLPSGSIFVEVAGLYGYGKNLFLNMANLMEISFYRWDVRPFTSKIGHTISLDNFEEIATALDDAWHKELAGLGERPADGACLFEYEGYGGKLSTYEQARCFLEQCSGTGLWRQCVHRTECDCPEDSQSLTRERRLSEWQMDDEEDWDEDYDDLFP